MKYTEKTTVRILHALERGATQKAAAAYGGVTEETFYGWCEDKPDFAQRVQEASHRGQVKLLEIIWAAGAEEKGGWRAAAWILEHRWARDFTIAAQSRSPLQEETRGPIDLVIKFNGDEKVED